MFVVNVDAEQIGFFILGFVVTRNSCHYDSSPIGDASRR